MYITDILSTATRIAEGEGNLFPIVDLKKETIWVTRNFVKSSSLKNIGKFFLKAIQDYSLSSQDVELVHRAFTAVVKGKRLDNLIQLSCSFSPVKGIKVKKKSRVVKLEREKAEGEKADAALKEALKTVLAEEEAAALLLKAAFIKEKSCILQKVIEETGIPLKQIEQNVRRMGAEGLGELVLLLKKVTESADPKKEYRLLKARLAGGVRFHETAIRTTYSVFESPLETATREKLPEPTKTRFNFPSQHGVSHLKKPAAEDLQTGSVPLNEATLLLVLLDQLCVFVNWEGARTNLINGMIGKINELLALEGVARKKITPFLVDMEESVKTLFERCSMIESLMPNETLLLKKWKQISQENTQIEQDNLKAAAALREENGEVAIFKELVLPPSFVGKRALGDIEHDLRTSLFETVQEAKKNKLTLEENCRCVHSQALLKLSSRKPFSGDLENELIAFGLTQIFERNPQNIALIKQLLQSQKSQ